MTVELTKSGRPKRKTGRPLTVIDLKRVEALAAQGLPQYQIANKLGIGASTFSRSKSNGKGHSYEEYEQALKAGYGKVGEEVQGHLLKQSRKGVTIASIFLAKQQHILGYRNEMLVTHDGQVNYSINTNVMPAVEGKPQAEAIDITPDTEPTD